MEFTFLYLFSLQDADDESEVDSESSSRPDSNNQASSEGSRSQSPAATTTKPIDNIQLLQQEQQQKLMQQQQKLMQQQLKQTQQQLLEQQFPTSQLDLSHKHQQYQQQHLQQQERNVEQQQQQQSVIASSSQLESCTSNEAHTFMPIKEELLEHDESDVPDDLVKLEKIKKRFKHIVTDPGNSCSRCERIFVYVRPKKPKQSEAEVCATFNDMHTLKFPTIAFRL